MSYYEQIIDRISLIRYYCTMKIFIIVLLNFLILSLLYAPPLKRGGLKCQKFLHFCENKKSEECVKHTNWALALTANIGDNKLGFENNKFLNLLYNSCKKEKNMFIENIALKLDLKSEDKSNKKD